MRITSVAGTFERGSLRVEVDGRLDPLVVPLRLTRGDGTAGSELTCEVAAPGTSAMPRSWVGRQVRLYHRDAVAFDGHVSRATAREGGSESIVLECRCPAHMLARQPMGLGAFAAAQAISSRDPIDGSPTPISQQQLVTFLLGPRNLDPRLGIVLGDASQLDSGAVFPDLNFADMTVAGGLAKALAPTPNVGWRLRTNEDGGSAVDFYRGGLGVGSVRRIKAADWSSNFGVSRGAAVVSLDRDGVGDQVVSRCVAYADPTEFHVTLRSSSSGVDDSGTYLPYPPLTPLWDRATEAGGVTFPYEESVFSRPIKGTSGADSGKYLFVSRAEGDYLRNPRGQAADPNAFRRFALDPRIRRVLEFVPEGPLESGYVNPDTGLSGREPLPPTMIRFEIPVLWSGATPYNGSGRWVPVSGSFRIDREAGTVTLPEGERATTRLVDVSGGNINLVGTHVALVCGLRSPRGRSDTWGARAAYDTGERWQGAEGPLQTASETYIVNGIRRTFAGGDLRDSDGNLLQIGCYGPFGTSGAYASLATAGQPLLLSDPFDALASLAEGTVEAYSAPEQAATITLPFAATGWYVGDRVELVGRPEARPMVAVGVDVDFENCQSVVRASTRRRPSRSAEAKNRDQQAPTSQQLAEMRTRPAPATAPTAAAPYEPPDANLYTVPYDWPAEQPQQAAAPAPEPPGNRYRHDATTTPGQAPSDFYEKGIPKDAFRRVGKSLAGFGNPPSLGEAAELAGRFASDVADQWLPFQDPNRKRPSLSELDLSAPNWAGRPGANGKDLYGTTGLPRDPQEAGEMAGVVAGRVVDQMVPHSAIDGANEYVANVGSGFASPR